LVTDVDAVRRRIPSSRLPVLVLAAIAIAAGLGRVGSAGPITAFGGSLYTLTSSLSSWTAAENEAISLGGHLVAINSVEEQNFLVATYLSGADATTKSYWIGINDQATEGVFVWSSGDPVTYTNWHSGEPNNFRGTEDYGVLNWHFAQQGNGPVGTWNDTPNDGVNGTVTGPLPFVGIIEVRSAGVPEIDPAGLTGVVALVAGALGIRERRGALRAKGSARRGWIGGALQTPPAMRSLPATVVLACAVAAMALPLSAGVVNYDVTADFSTTNGNPNGVWTYGWEATGGTTFNTYTSNGSNYWAGFLTGDGNPSIYKNLSGGTIHGLAPGQLALHPGPSGQPSIARWTAPAGIAPSISVSGQFLPGDWGVMQVGVFFNNNWTAPIFQAADAGAFSFTRTVMAGDTIDFAVYGGYGYGTTPIDARITASTTGAGVPEIDPAGLTGVVALVAGALGLRERHRGRSRPSAPGFGRRVVPRGRSQATG